jgi:hypothetical protein
MQFKITRHTGAGAPRDAVELLWGQIEGRQFEEVAFSRRGAELGVSVGHDSPVSMERDEREEVARMEVLACLREICEGVSDLRFDWFAVGPRR